MASGKVDNRNPFGSKRSRNDGSRSEGDWTCPQCQNVNFGFRTVCNRGKCGAPKPPRTPRMGSVPPPGPFDHPPPFYVGGMGASPIPPVPQVIPNGYGPPISVPGMRYNYGTPGNVPGPYSLLSAYPGHIGGMGYAPRPMDGYGFGFQGTPLPMSSPWSGGSVADNNASRKRRGGPDGLSEGDWICPKCENVNFAFRSTCNMKKCGTPRPSTGQGPNQSSGVPEGSWTCSKCENINYPFRTVCNRKGCGNEKPSS